MKINCLYIVLIAAFLLAVCHGCDHAQEMKEEPLPEDPFTKDPLPEDPVNGTVWKLSGIVDSETSVIKTLAPTDCDACYTLWFDTIEYTITAINIGSRLKLDLLNLRPPMIQDIPFCERYDKDEKMYCDADLFFRSIVSTESYSVTDDELKLVVIGGRSYLSFIPHKGDNPSTSRRGKKWKLAGLVDVQSGALDELQPTDCPDCYTLTFWGDFVFTSQSIWARQGLDLSNLDVALDPHRPLFYSNDYPPLYSENDPIGDGKQTHDDSFRYRCGIAYTKSYEFTDDGLKLFFVNKEKNYYLLFKSMSK